MSTVSKKKNRETKKIEEVIKPSFPNADVEVYRYNSASIRVRMIDIQFRGKSKAERHDMVAPLLRNLPENTQADITVLLLLSPEELETSPMNVEFEYPSPSRL
jgi:stress-induced morphogen